MIVTIRPLGSHVAIRLKAVPSTSQGGLHLASSQHPMKWGTVVSVGEWCRLVTVGQTVLVNTLSGNEVNGLLVVQETAIVLSDP